MANIVGNLARLRALSYRLAVAKHWVDCMIARLENRKHYPYLSQNDFNWDYISPMQDKFERLDYSIKSAMKELKG